MELELTLCGLKNYSKRGLLDLLKCNLKVERFVDRTATEVSYIQFILRGKTYSVIT